MDHTTFGHTNINLYNNYASSSYATYTSPQYTTANPNRCPPNANIKPTSSGYGSGGASDRNDSSKSTTKQQSTKHGHHHILRKNKLDNGSSTTSTTTNPTGDVTVVANNCNAVTTTKHERFNESVIEEGQNNFVSRFRFVSEWQQVLLAFC